MASSGVVPPPFVLTNEDRARARALSSAQLTFLEEVERRPEWVVRSSFPGVWDPSELFNVDVQPWPLFVSRAVLDATSKDVARFVTNFEDTVWRCARAPDVIDPALRERYAAPLAAAARRGPRLARSVRADLVETEEGFRLLELNVTGALGGWQLVHYQRRLLASELVRSFFDEHAPTAELLEPFSRAMRRFVELARRRDGVIALVGPSGLQEDVRAFVQAGLRATAASVVDGEDAELLHYVDPNDLLGGPGGVTLRAGGHRVAVTVDGTLGQPEEGVLASTEADAVDVFCGPLGALLSDKRWMARMSADASTSDADEARFVRRLLPWTRVVRRGAVATLDGWSAPWETLLENARERLVLKPPDQYGGRGVCLGREATSGEWSEACAEALESGTWIVQERAAPVLRPMQNVGDGAGAHVLAWGWFVLDGEIVGMYPRSLAAERGDVVNVARGAEGVLAYVVDEPVASEGAPWGRSRLPL